MKKFAYLIPAIGLTGLVGSVSAKAEGLERVRFVVVDARTQRPVPGAGVTIEDLQGGHAGKTLYTEMMHPGITPVFSVRNWQVEAGSLEALDSHVTRIVVPVGTVVRLQTLDQTPVKDIYIKVTARRLPVRAQETAGGSRRDQRDLSTFVNKTAGDTKALIQGQSGVASDSNGQQHIRGEHADITYIVDGVPLPDTLSGRQGSVVVPSTINSLEILTGGYAPEFGGQTAALLNITTLPGATKSRADLTLQAGNYDTTNGDFSAVGPLGKYASYVLDISGTRSRNAIEPQQPDNQTAHNTGSDQSFFAKFRYAPGSRDTLNLTLSRAPDTSELNNRTGLPASFANLGQGYGFLGQRNADGSRPDANADNSGLLGAAPQHLLSQQEAGQDITQREMSEFATLSWRRQLSTRDVGLFAVTFLHSGQDVHNHNPAVDMLNLPVDNSIEYNPTAVRNVHHVQWTGSLSSKRGAHLYKTGVLLDNQYGNEFYEITPASQLSMNALAALAPNMVPSGNIQTDSTGNSVLDINGNPIYRATSNTAATLTVHRSGFYRAAYLQDTWQMGKHFNVNYGVRADWYKQTQNLGQPTISTFHLCPRLNFTYSADRLTTLRWSYNRLFNTPPLAQGAVVGQPIEPELLDQYDVSVERQIARGQTIKIAYYIKQIHNQVDTGLLIPGSQIGLYSAVNLQYGGIHGIEFSYELTPVKEYGWDAYVNYTYSIARPNGVDNTGAPVANFNDHDQRNTIGIGVAYNWKSGASAAVTINHGSGLASSPTGTDGKRIPRTQVDLRLSTGPGPFHGRGGVGLDITNIFDDRTVINFQSAFSGTRFQQGRRVLASAFVRF